MRFPYLFQAAREDLRKSPVGWVVLVAAVIAAAATLTVGAMAAMHLVSGRPPGKPQPVAVNTEQLLGHLRVDFLTGDIGSEAVVPVRAVLKDFASRCGSDDLPAQSALFDFLSSGYTDSLISYYSRIPAPPSDFEFRLGLSILSVMREAGSTSELVYGSFSDAERAQPTVALSIMSVLVGTQHYREAKTFADSTVETLEWSRDQSVRLKVLKGVALRPLDLSAAVDIHKSLLEQLSADADIDPRTKFYVMVSYMASALSQPIPREPAALAVYQKQLETIARLKKDNDERLERSADDQMKLRWAMVSAHYEFSVAFLDLTRPPSGDSASPRVEADTHFARAEVFCRSMLDLARKLSSIPGVDQATVHASMVRAEVACVRQQWTVAVSECTDAIKAASLPRDRVDAYMLTGHVHTTRAVALLDDPEHAPQARQLFNDGQDCYAIALGIALENRLDTKVKQVRSQLKQAEPFGRALDRQSAR